MTIKGEFLEERGGWFLNCCVDTILEYARKVNCELPAEGFSMPCDQCENDLIWRLGAWEAFIRRPLSVYISAPYQFRDSAYALLQLLDKRGISCTARWLTDGPEADSEDSAIIDLEDIDKADALVLVNPELYRHSGTGGRHVEFGYALKSSKHLFVFGPRTNVFHRLRAVTVVESFEALVSALRLCREATA